MKRKGFSTTENTARTEVDAVASGRSVANTEDLPDGFQMTELGPLPKEWRVVRLGEVAEYMKAGGTPSRKETRYWGGNIPFVLIEDMTSCGLYLASTKETITPEGLEHSSAWLVPPGSLLLSMYATIGETCINLIPVATNQAILAIIPSSTFCPEFGAYLLKFYSGRLAQYNVQSTQKNVNKRIVENFLIPLPPLPEQRAIAHVLRTVQRAKETTEGVIAALKELKKSLMQHLFTYGPVPVAERERVPLQETEIGPLPKEWRVVRLGEVAEFGKNRTMQKPKASLIPFMPMSLLPEDTIYISQWEMRRDKEIRSGIPIQNGDFLLAKITPSFENGKQGIVKDIPGGWGYASTEVIPIRPYPELHTKYLAFYLKQPSIRQELAGKMEGSTGRQRLPKMAVQQLLIPLPPLAEQCEIARMLQAVDAKIAAEERRRAALEELFKTLLHALMSGRMRVPHIVGGERSCDSAPDADKLPKSED